MKKLALALTIVAFVIAGFAGELGQPASQLKIAEWVKGKPVDLAAAKDKQVVVVEFWATWCPPCVKSIPHLTEMQKKFKDVLFVGVSTEKSDVVKKFVAKMGDKMDYNVAIDEDGKTSVGYLEPFGIGVIPHAFIVDKKGRVVWHGHPMDGLDKAVEEVLAGKLDIETAKKRDNAIKKLETFYDAAESGADDAILKEMGVELEKLDAELGGFKTGEKFNATEILKEIKFRGLLRSYHTAVRSGQSGTNLAGIVKLIDESAPKGFDLAGFKETMNLSVTFANYYYAASGKRDIDKLAEYTKAISENKTTNAVVLNEWAWVVLTDPNLTNRDTALAIKLAKSAVDASREKEASILDTYALALFDSGNISEAIVQQQKAVAAATDEETKKELRDKLEKYKAKSAAK
jgi:thiol-disulfide isomerase/thioredoxin